MPDAYQSAKSSLPPDPGGGGVVSFASWEELERAFILQAEARKKALASGR